MKIIARKEFVTIRIEHGFSLTALAAKMQVSASVVHSLEQFNNVRPATAKKACMALDEPFNKLFYIEEE